MPPFCFAHTIDERPLSKEESLKKRLHLCKSKGDKLRGAAQMGMIFNRTSNLMWVIAESFLRAVTEKGVDHAP